MKNWIAAMMACAALAVMHTRADTGDAMYRRRADEAWNLLATRLLHPRTGILTDALAPDDGTAGLRCERYLPTPEEIAKQFPNPNGWGTTMEDGVLHTVPFLLSALARHRATGDGESATIAKKTFEGLKRCVEIPGTGYLARNICPMDGKSFYWNCSRDQYTLWIYGMWRYFHSPLATERDKADIARLASMVARFHERCVTPENKFNSVRFDGKVGMVCRMWVTDPFATPRVTAKNGGSVEGLCAHEAMRLHMIYLATWDLSGDAHWKELYEKIADGGLRIAELPLRENLAGFTSFQMQLSHRLLWELDPDPARKGRLMKLLERGADCAEYSFSVTERILKERNGDISAPADNWRGYRFRYLGDGPWEAPGRMISGFTYMWPEWPKDFGACYTCAREFGEGMCDRLLVPGRRKEDAWSARFRSQLAKMDFRTHCSSGAAYPLLAYWWQISPE